jgi:hypothetical protein
LLYITILVFYNKTIEHNTTANTNEVYDIFSGFTEININSYITNSYMRGRYTLNSSAIVELKSNNKIDFMYLIIIKS